MSNSSSGDAYDMHETESNNSTSLEVLQHFNLYVNCDHQSTSKHIKAHQSTSYKNGTGF